MREFSRRNRMNRFGIFIDLNRKETGKFKIKIVLSGIILFSVLFIRADLLQV